MPRLKKIITVGCDAGGDPLCLTFGDLITLGQAHAASGALEFRGAGFSRSAR